MKRPTEPDQQRVISLNQQPSTKGKASAEKGSPEVSGNKLALEGPSTSKLQKGPWASHGGGGPRCSHPSPCPPGGPLQPLPRQLQTPSSWTVLRSFLAAKSVLRSGPHLPTEARSLRGPKKGVGGPGPREQGPQSTCEGPSITNKAVQERGPF